MASSSAEDKAVRDDKGNILYTNGLDISFKGQDFSKIIKDLKASFPGACNHPSELSLAVRAPPGPLRASQTTSTQAPRLSARVCSVSSSAPVSGEQVLSRRSGDQDPFVSLCQAAKKHGLISICRWFDVGYSGRYSRLPARGAE